MDSVLLNRSPQVQVGIIDLDEKPSYSIRVVFQDHDKMPITGTTRPKKNKTKLYLLDHGTKDQLESRKASGRSEEKAIPGDIAPNHPSMPDYKGRFGCDYPIGSEILDQTISLVQTAKIEEDSDLDTRVDIRKPIEIAKESVISYCFTVEQYRHFLKEFEEEGKIELSKTAWYHLYDQGNFKLLENEFEDPTSLQLILNYTQENQ